MRFKKPATWIAGIILLSLAGFFTKTALDLRRPDLSPQKLSASAARFQVLDRRGAPLSVTYQNSFNTSDIVPLHAVPELLRSAFIASEDRHFFEHAGVDWNARLSAIWQNIHARRAVRGASTITEQVVRIIHPRPRTLWSRWIEGFEAMWLEARASKGEILEFYLNQIPYAANRRGVAQASSYYFNRDLETLTPKEMLALAILPRAPSAYDLYKDTGTIDAAVGRLAGTMETLHMLGDTSPQQIAGQTLHLEPPSLPLNASHFVSYLRDTVPYQLSHDGKLTTTLDASIQNAVQKLLDERLKTLEKKNVHHGAAMVVDTHTGEILAWVVAHSPSTPATDINAVLSPRQPGSSMKPFLYTLALDQGWSPATILDDAPMAEAIGSGLHDFHNYSHTFYGKISLREALGNSLNIPALQTIGFVGTQHYLDTLHALGFESLTQEAEFYKDGLALGNGEVSLYEMVQAYTALASRGVFRALTPLAAPPYAREQKRIYSDEAASLIANILSDPYARRREFGAGSVLNLPVQTAVKTGTSSDYRDAWVFGFNAHHLVGIWMGNLNQAPMDGVTGSTGPALVMRGIFAMLNKTQPPEPLYLSPALVRKDICAAGEKPPCYTRTEYFIAGTEHDMPAPIAASNAIKIIRPTEGLQLAYDPRIDKAHQAFEFVADHTEHQSVEWRLNDKPLAQTTNGKFLWPVERGAYQLTVRALDEQQRETSSDHVNFVVK